MKSYELAALEILRGKQPEEPVEEEKVEEQEQVEEAAVHPDALHVKPVKMDGKTKYKVHAVGSNYSSGIKVGEHLSDSELDDFSEMGGKIKHMKEEAEDLDEVTINDPLLKKVGPIRARDNTTGRVGPEDQKWGKEQVKQAVKTSIQRMKSDKKPNLPEEVEELEEAATQIPLPAKSAESRYNNVISHAKKMGYNVHHNEHFGDEKSGNKGVPDITVHYERGDHRGNADPVSVAVHKDGKAAKDSTLMSIARGKLKEGVELDEMGPGKLPRIDKQVEKEYGDKLMADFKAKGGEVKQVKSPALPKNRNRMVARGSLSSGERTMTRSGGKSYTSRMEEVEEDYDQLIEEKNAFEIELPEQLSFADYLKAAKQFTESYDDAVVVADSFFNQNDESLVIEAFMRSDIEDRVKMHQKAGSEVSLPKYSTKDGKPHAEYVVTDKDSGKKTKYIHHGTMRRVERMN